MYNVCTRHFPISLLSPTLSQSLPLLSLALLSVCLSLARNKVCERGFSGHVTIRYEHVPSYDVYITAIYIAWSLR